MILIPPYGALLPDGTARSGSTIRSSIGWPETNEHPNRHRQSPDFTAELINQPDHFGDLVERLRLAGPEEDE